MFKWQDAKVFLEVTNEYVLFAFSKQIFINQP